MSLTLNMASTVLRGGTLKLSLHSGHRALNSPELAERERQRTVIRFSRTTYIPPEVVVMYAKAGNLHAISIIKQVKQPGHIPKQDVNRYLCSVSW